MSCRQLIKSCPSRASVKKVVGLCEHVVRACVRACINRVQGIFPEALLGRFLALHEDDEWSEQEKVRMKDAGREEGEYTRGEGMGARRAGTDSLKM